MSNKDSSGIVQGYIVIMGALWDCARITKDHMGIGAFFT